MNKHIKASIEVAKWTGAFVAYCIGLVLLNEYVWEYSSLFVSTSLLIFCLYRIALIDINFKEAMSKWDAK